ncbi:unnamed protein product [Prunus brigantina]
MAKTRPERKDVDSYTIRGTNKVDDWSNAKVRVRWYYRPEESIGGRRNADTIEGKCRVQSLKNYAKLENVGAENYYCRFEYKADTGELAPDIVAVHCKCEMSYNPDELMVKPQSQNAFSASPEADAKVLPLPFLEASLTFTEDFQDLAGQWAAIEKNYKEAEVYKNTFSTSVRDLEQERKTCSPKYSSK